MTSYINNSGCPFSTTELSFPPATADSRFERKAILSGEYNFETVASMVDKNFEYF